MTKNIEQSARKNCAARVSTDKWYLHHNTCKRFALDSGVLCRLHQNMFERDGFITCTSGFDEPLYTLRREDKG